MILLAIPEIIRDFNISYTTSLLDIEHTLCQVL